MQNLKPKKKFFIKDLSVLLINIGKYGRKKDIFYFQFSQKIIYFSLKTGLCYMVYLNIPPYIHMHIWIKLLFLTEGYPMLVYN